MWNDGESDGMVPVQVCVCRMQVTGTVMCIEAAADEGNMWLRSLTAENARVCGLPRWRVRPTCRMAKWIAPKQCMNKCDSARLSRLVSVAAEGEEMHSHICMQAQQSVLVWSSLAHITMHLK